jgi:hypothetical protein
MNPSLARPPDLGPEETIARLDLFVQQARRTRVVLIPSTSTGPIHPNAAPHGPQYPVPVVQAGGQPTVQEDGTATHLFGSRFGGSYAWPNPDGVAGGAAAAAAGGPPPDDFFCLMQINLQDVYGATAAAGTTATTSTTTIRSAWSPPPFQLPPSGLLQVFIRADANYGMQDVDFRGTGFRVVYHPAESFTPDIVLRNRRPVLPSAVLLLADPAAAAAAETRNGATTTSSLPLGTRARELLTTGIPITSFVRQDNVPPSRNDYRIETSALSLLTVLPNRHTAAAASTSSTTLSSSLSPSSHPFEQWYDERIIPLDHESTDAVAWLGGHPRWSQGDIRMHYPNDQYEALVSFSSEGGDIFVWGDGGDATFLIKHEDLMRLNFSNMLYSWDCF